MGTAESGALIDISCAKENKRTGWSGPIRAKAFRPSDKVIRNDGEWTKMVGVSIVADKKGLDAIWGWNVGFGYFHEFLTKRARRGA